MDHWQLVDSTMSVDGPECFPRITIQSEAQLRTELSRLRDREPGIFVLECPHHAALQIGIGGPFAGLRLFRNRNAEAVVLAERPYCDKRIDFLAEDDHIAFWPENLMPVDQVINIVVYFFNQHRLPDWITWKKWDAVQHRWIIETAASVRSA